MIKSGKSFEYAPTVQLLLEHGASVCLQNKDGLTPLHFAVQHRRSDVVALLLQLGAPLDALDNDNMMSRRSNDRKYSVKAQQVCLRKELSTTLTKSFILYSS
jgi:ankyrin repeat protein